MTDLAILNSPLSEVSALQPETIAQMRALFEQTFQNCDHFERDLREKDWVLLLHDEAGELCGFSTLARSLETLDQPSVVFFSGDTVVQPGHRHRIDLPRLWARHVFSMVSQETLPCYWFFICSGFRTYRFLPIFYKEFFPRHDLPTPPQVQVCIDRMARRRFGDLYQDGIVRLHTPCREPLPERRLDAHSRFFLERNPGWVEGHELACLTRLHPDNQTSALQRLLR